MTSASITPDEVNPAWIALVGSRPNRDYVDKPQFIAELAAVTVEACSNPSDPAAVRVSQSIRHDLVKLMHRAHQGTVRVGEGKDLDEYEFPLQSAREPVGELRHPVKPPKHIEGWQYRVYFGAPHEEVTTLVWLLPGRKLSSKVDSDSWEETQRTHITEAKSRMSRWVTNWHASSMREN